MSSILIKNGFIITMNEQEESFFGDILIEDDTIKEIAERIEEDADELIDASGKVVVPGFIQTHVHLCQSLFRNLANDMELLNWLDVIMPLEGCHDESSIEASARLGIAEMLKSGTTTISDMGNAYLYEETALAVEKTGIRAQLGRTIMDSDWAPEYLKHETRRGIEETEQFIRKWHDREGSVITCGIPVRWILTTSDETFAAIKRIAGEYNVPIHQHANESTSENEVIIQEKGMTAIEYFHTLGLTEHKLQLAHCIWVSEEETDILQNHDVSVLHCPSCNLKTASGIAPIPEYLQRGINVSIGSDTSGSNDNLDPFIEMRIAAIMQKPRTGPTSITARDVFRMATIEGAKALQLDSRIGSLEEGKKADVVLVNQGLRNAPFHYDEAVSALVYSSNGRDVDTTIVNGRVLVQNGELNNIDEDQLVEQADEEVRKVVDRAKKRNLI
jgi:cytosine/adenosine deaminase-related metal-dependent hydrolase